MLPALSELLLHNDKQILCKCEMSPLSEQQLQHLVCFYSTADACWALSYVTDDSGDKIQAVLDAGCVPKLVNLLNCDDITIITPALRSVGNIVTGDDVQTDAVLAAGVLPVLNQLLQHKKPNIVKEAAWTVSNITAGNQHQIQQVMDQDVIPPLIKILESGDFKAQREAVWCITNITSGGSTEQVIRLIEQYPIVKPYCDLLSSKDSRTLMVVIQGLQSLFKTAEAINGVSNLCVLVEEIGALDKLEALQNHEVEEIYEKAYLLIDTYFSENVSLDNECALITVVITITLFIFPFYLQGCRGRGN